MCCGCADFIRFTCDGMLKLRATDVLGYEESEGGDGRVTGAGEA